MEVPASLVPPMEPVDPLIPPRLESDPLVLPAEVPCEEELREPVPRWLRFAALAFVEELRALAPCRLDCPDPVPTVDPDPLVLADPDDVD